ncbi:hypothetical protein M3Y97_01080500 [Aphelenchoides bicaudatus]|nr:hypothetical protein M3Y97_01080500 [Aphelenchoides bicaudatus]
MSFYLLPVISVLIASTFAQFPPIGGPIGQSPTPETPFGQSLPSVNTSLNTNDSVITLPTIEYPNSTDSATPLPTDIFRPRFKRACTKCVGHHGLCVIGEGNCYAPDGCYFCGGCGANEARCQDPKTEPCQCYKDK